MRMDRRDLHIMRSAFALPGNSALKNKETYSSTIGPPAMEVTISGPNVVLSVASPFYKTKKQNVDCKFIELP